MPCCGFDLLIFPSIYLCNMNARKEFLNINKLGIWSRLWFDSKAGGENRKIDRSPADILRINSYDRQSTKKNQKCEKKNKVRLDSLLVEWFHNQSILYTLLWSYISEKMVPLSIKLYIIFWSTLDCNFTKDMTKLQRNAKKIRKYLATQRFGWSTI